MTAPRTRGTTPTPPGLDVLVIDDEAPALGELAYLLCQDDRIGTVTTAESAVQALRFLRERRVDAVFSDIRMPGLDGLELAQLLRQFSDVPAVVFVTAHDEHAVPAFDLDVVDYVLKPVRAERLREAVRRVLGVRERADQGVEDVEVPVELGGVTRFVRRSSIAYVTASGDYARLHTRTESYLVRMTLAHLEDEWRSAGFLRIHRSVLVSGAHVEDARIESGRFVVVVAGRTLLASRRHTRELRGVLPRVATEPTDPT
jgi:DNA-binding LytR/AlgR family response regulator